MKTKELPLELPGQKAGEPLNGILQNQQPGITTSFEWVPPAQALEWLEHNNKKNRSVSQRVVKRYAEAMKAGKWKVTGQGIEFDKFGNLVNGQHRLEAILLAGIPVYLLIIRGVEPDTFDVYDSGHNRTPGHVLNIEGCTYSIKVAAAIRLILNHNGGKLNQKVGRTNVEIVEFYREETDYLNEIATKCVRWYNSVRIAPPSRLITLYYIIRKAGNSEAAVDLFFNRVCDGIGLEANTPEYALRTKLLKLNATKETRLEPHRMMGMWIKAWNYSKRGKSMKNLKFPVGSNTPKIL